jgi:hypothetical protein
MEYFKKLVQEETNKIVTNVKANLNKCLRKRGQDFSAFEDWAADKGAPKAALKRLKMNHFSADLSEDLSLLVLAATFMNKLPEEVFFSIQDSF